MKFFTLGSGYGAKLAVSHLVLVVAVGIPALVWADRTLRRDLVQGLDDRLAHQAQAAADWVKQGRHPGRIAERLSRIVDARVTILDDSGAVLDDSGEAEPRGDERHATVPVGDGRRLRLSTDIAGLEAALSGMRQRLLAIGAIGMALALVLARSLSQLAKRLEENAERIARLEASRRAFLANASHELRTPVTAIQGYTDLLLRGADAEATKRYLEILHRHARRIGGLVTDSLSLSEVEARTKDRLVIEPVNLRRAAEQAALTVRENSPATASVSIQIDSALFVLAEPGALEQIIENLVENAIRYGREHGTVTLSATSLEGRVELSVADDGPGISAEDLPRVFERFFRVDPARSREHGGTGLGLSIVKELARSLNGDVVARSTVGAGTFFVTLPLAASPAARGETPARVGLA